ncbi:MAG: alpha/beta hydrolase [Chitinophagales bacterium]|nr:alpha/beta hydrolase [Chitinophagales bacterium]
MPWTKRISIIVAIIMFVLLAVFIYFAWLRPNLIIPKAVAKERYARPNSKFIQWQGTELHYTEAGQGPTVLLIHGFGGNFSNFDSLAPKLADSYRVVCVDLPGFGLSDQPRAEGLLAPLYHEYFNMLFDTLHIDSALVIGNSMGGWMAWELAASHPDKVRKLVLLNSAGYDLDRVKKNLGRLELLDTKLFKLLSARGIPMFMSNYNAHRIRAKDAYVNPEEVMLHNALTNREGNFQNLARMANSTELPDTANIQKVACPTLIVWGDDDRIVPVEHAQRFKRDIPDSRMLIYEKCGHVPQLEVSGKLAKDIKAFFGEPSNQSLSKN